MGKIKTEELKNKYFYEMGIKKFRRFRQIWVKIFGFWFFKDSDPILAKNQVKKIDTEIHCQKDINEYMARLMEKEMNTKKPLWEIHVAENYEDDTSIVFILIHHMLSDGMGIISLITFLNDNQNTESIQHFRDLSFVHKYVFPIVYIPLGIIKYAMSGILCKGDPNMTPFVLKDGIPSMEKKYLETKNYNFSDLKCCYSRFEGVKLNNYLMSCISVSLSKYFNELGISTDKQTHYTISVPYNMKPQPKCIDDVQFLNYNSHILVNLPLNSNFEYVINEYKRRVNPNISMF